MTVRDFCNGVGVMISLDDFDRRILSALQQEGRLTSQQLAERTALSASQCGRRQRLEELGVIKAYRASLSQRKLGIGIMVFIDVTLTTHSQGDISSFIRLIETNKNILEAAKLTGGVDFLLKVVARDLDQFNDLISNQLLPHPAVASVQSHIVLEWLKEGGEFPIPDNDPGK
jgi:DNA-binding Lrp family transcriptional regulator